MVARAVGGAAARGVAGVKTAVCGRRVVADFLGGSSKRSKSGEKAPVLNAAGADETPPEPSPEEKPSFAVAASSPSLWRKRDKRRRRRKNVGFDRRGVGGTVGLERRGVGGAVDRAVVGVKPPFAVAASSPSF